MAISALMVCTRRARVTIAVFGGVTDGITADTRAQRRSFADQCLGRASTQLDAQIVGRGDDQVTELPGGPDADRPRRTFRDQQRPQRLHVAGPALGVPTSSSRQ